jgi:hypothetical protein
MQRQFRQQQLVTRGHLIRTIMRMCVLGLSLVICGCGGDSKGPTAPSAVAAIPATPAPPVPPAPPGSSNVTIYTNQSYPEFLNIRRGDGGRGIYLGQKNGDGMPTQVLEAIVDARDVDPRKQGRIKYDADGRPRSATLASGDYLQFDWSSRTQANMTMVAGDGSMLLKAPISIQGSVGLAASRNARSTAPAGFTPLVRLC